MNVEEIFKKISLHMLEGIMIHEEMANYFAFLKLNGYEILQSKRFMDESKTYDKMNSYYINHYCKLIPRFEIKTIPKIIPDTLYNHSRDDISTNDIRQMVKDVFKYWVEWEESTKLLYEQSYIDLIDNNSDVSAAIIIKELLSEVNDELEIAKDYWYKLSGSNFDIVFIMEDQKSNE